MPRVSATPKRQQGAAHQRDTRHENGLVGPGKRVQKQKSNGHLNGHAKSSESNSSTPPLPGTPPATNGHVRSPVLGDHPVDNKMPGETVRRVSLNEYSDYSTSDSYQTPSANLVPEENHRQIDVNAAKNPAVHRDSGPLSLALTVLRSCPLYDTIAILIVLLQIPPTFLSIIHLLFASLTFVPPSAAVASGLSFTDILQGTLSTPSIATIFFVDGLVLMIWLFLWSPLQDIALDLAQTVIALTLGGGTSGKEAGMKNVLVCFGIISVSHFARNGSVKQSGLRAILSSSNGLLGSSDSDDPLEPISYHHSKKHGLIRSILAIHILTQGVVRYIRDWYVRREKRDHSASIGDPEAGKPSTDAHNDTTPNTHPAENDSLPTFSGTSLPAPNGVVMAKKKKKQSNQVRIRQPLWAALASTKIVMVKEYETSHTAAESAGTNATDVNNLGNAPFNSEADRIWITYVGFDEVFFSTSFFPTYTPPDNSEEKSLDSSGIDMSKPFFVRVNKTIWQPTRMNAAIDPEQPQGQNTRWSGEIFGLAPMSNYECDFVSTVNQVVLFSTSVRTLQSPTADLAVGLSPNPQVSGRPSSPITTLKTSIATAEVKLAEERNRQKRERKDQRAKLNSVRKEIESLISKIAAAGGSDDKNRQKVQQSNLHAKQAKDAMVQLASQIDELSTIPLDEATLYNSSKSEFHAERDQQKKLTAHFKSAKEAADRDIQALNNELSALQQKRERMQSRIAKLNGEHERITDANARGLDEAQRKERERQAKEMERANIKNLMIDRLHELNSQINEGTSNLQSLFAHIEALQQAEMYGQTSPTTSAQNLTAAFAESIPESSAMNASAYPWNPAGPSTSSLYATGYGAAAGMLVAPGPGNRTRGRSSSMLSTMSRFTQSSDEAGPSNMAGNGKMIWEDAREERHGSSGSGSGGSGPGSVGDPKSPIGNGIAQLHRWL
jgi:hypothetical protein